MRMSIKHAIAGTLWLCASATFAQPASTADVPGAAPVKPPKATAQSEAGEPRAAIGDEKTPTATKPPATTFKTAAKASSAADKLQLGTATVTGDREQPKVMYVVPWKRSDIGELGGKPMNSLVDEILSPVDRDVFKREVHYYQTVSSEAAHNSAQPAAAQGEK